MGPRRVRQPPTRGVRNNDPGIVPGVTDPREGWEERRTQWLAGR